MALDFTQEASIPHCSLSRTTYPQLLLGDLVMQVGDLESRAPWTVVSGCSGLAGGSGVAVLTAIVELVGVEEVVFPCVGIEVARLSFLQVVREGRPAEGDVQETK